MKNHAVIVLAVMCLIVQDASSMPDRPQDIVDRVKAKAQEAVEAAQEAASRAMESAKAVLHEAMDAASQAKQQGMETGQEWIEYGKSVVASFANQTVVEDPDKQPEE